MLAIAGGKGGCGKTTTALGLARAFAAAGERPLVVDGDCDMPNLHTMADTDRMPGLGELADDATLDRAIHRSPALPGVDVVPAGSATGALAPSTLHRVRRARDRVIVDCPAGATEAVAAPLREADAALVVSTPDCPGLVDAAKTARMARALGTRVPGAVVTHAASRDRGGDADCHGSAFDARSGSASDPLRAECEVLVEIPELDRESGSVLGDPVGQSSYERLAFQLNERNI